MYYGNWKIVNFSNLNCAYAVIITCAKWSYNLFCDLNILWTIWSLNFACLNLTRILFREKRQIIKLNRENKYQYVLLFD